MTTLHKNKKCLRLAACALASIVPFLHLHSAHAVAVDSEILLLVDVTKEMSQADFSNMTQGIADSFQSSSVISAIQSGNTGSIAVSVVFFSKKNKYQTAVDWVQISDSVSAEAFAQSLRSTSKPKKAEKKNALGDTIANIQGDFGTETGQPANGYESSVQMINVIGHSKDNHTPPGNNHDQAVKDASTAALGSGVDVINAIAVTQSDSTMAAYYQNFVIGGSVGSQSGSVASAPNYASLTTTLTPTLASNLSAAAISTVPEPASSLFVVSSCALLLIRRR